MRMQFVSVFLFVLGAGRSLAVPPTATVETVYQTLCASCHGTDMHGGLGTPLDDGNWQHGESDAKIFRNIKNGLPELGMVGFGKKLRDDQIRSLVVYIREFEKFRQKNQQSHQRSSANNVVETQYEKYKIDLVVTSGLHTPWGLAFLPSGEMLVTERGGWLRVVSPAGKLRSEPVRGTPTVIAHGQGGLMAVSLHPNYADNGWVYLGFSHGRGRNSLTAIVRGRIRNGEWVDQEWIYQPDKKFWTSSGVHFGTRIVFRDGYVFFAVGERGGWQEAQDITRPNGKIFRLYDDGRVPEDNPFVGQKKAIAGIWSYGHRNPQGMAIDPRDGELYLTEHGPRGGDEFNRIQRGGNYGWPRISHGINYDGRPFAESTGAAGYVSPLLHWTPSIAPCGLAFYQGKKFPAWDGDYFAGSLRAEELHRLRLSDGQVVEDEIILRGHGRIRDVATTADGDIYIVLNQPDAIIRLQPAN